MIKEDIENIASQLSKVAKSSVDVENIKTLLGLNESRFIFDDLFNMSKLSRDVHAHLFFIDGGLCNIILTPTLSVDIIRVAIIAYLIDTTGSEKNKHRFVHEFVSLSIKQGDYWKIEILPIKAHYKISTKISNVNDIGNYVRHFLELYCANKTSSQIILKSNINDKVDNNAPSIIVFDGNIEALNNDEQRLISKMASKNIIGGLSKTTQLTVSDESAPYLIYRIAQSLGKHVFIYKLKQEKDRRIFLVKLHKKSEYVFRLDSLLTYTNEQLRLLLSSLIQFSDDVSFYGYPYPLVEADRLARISSTDKQYYQTLLKTKLKSLLKHIEIQEHGMDAHSILDQLWY